MTALLALLLALPASAEPPARPRYSTECVLRIVAHRMGSGFRADVPMPKVRFASEVPIKEFQDAVEKQWRMRPAQVLNVFVFDRNEIYLLDDMTYYRKVNRFIDDSLAHELAHYVQVKYRGWTIDGGDDSLEGQAIDVQSWFRDTYLRNGPPPTAPCGPKGSLNNH